MSSPESVLEFPDPDLPNTAGDPYMDKESCKTNVLIVFEDICPKHLDGLAEAHGYNPDLVIAAILDQQEKGIQYPRPDNPRKRKRAIDGEEINDNDDKSDINTIIDTQEHAIKMQSTHYKIMAKTLISQDFPTAPLPDILSILKDQDGSLFRAYSYMDESTRNGNLAWRAKKKPTVLVPKYSPDHIQNLPLNELAPPERAALDEFLSARNERNRKDELLAMDAEELQNIERARIEGQMGECGCCYDEFPLNRMVHCEGDVAHFFCRECMKQHANTQIGYSKYELICMSTSECTGGYSRAQRQTFLDEKMQVALDRIEQEAILRMAGIENLETCPFCPFAMEYPPVEENKEFRCANTDCELVSCRLCRKVTHIPKTCEEAAKEECHDARHTIEEAMSAAVIRKCNRCANPFIKQSGCNKITCTRCRAIQCYVCRKTVKDYSHFDDSDRGGKAGQCPLFDSTEDRHQNEVRAAEEVAREKVTQENPDVDAEKFEINVSDRVKADEDQRKQQQASHVRPGVVRAMPQAQQALQDMIIARQQAAGNRQALVPPPGIAAAEIRPALRAYEAPRFQFVEPPAVRPHQPPPAAQRRLGHVPSGFVQLADHAGQRPRPIVGRQNERRAVLDHALPPIENMRQTIHASGNQRLRLGNEIPFPPPQADPFMGALLPLHDNAIPFQQFLGFGEQPFGGNNLGDLRDEIERLAGVRSVGHAVESQRQRQAGNAERTQQLLESTKQRNQQRASESQRQAQRAVDIRRRMPVLQSPPQRPGANGNGMVGLQRRQERMLGQVRELQLAQEQVNHPHPLPVPERRALASYLPVGLLAGRPPAPHGFPRAPAADLRGTGA